MKISPINSYTVKNSYTINPIKQNTVSFLGNKEETAEAKPTLLDKLKGVFSKKPLTPEEEKSDEIKYFLGDINAHIKDFKSFGKDYSTLLDDTIELGRRGEFKGYIQVDENDRIVFSNVDEQTGLPESATVISMPGFNMKYAFNLVDGQTLFSVHDYTFEDTDILLTVLNKKVIYYLETDKKTGISKQVMPFKNGFKYFEGKLDEEGNPKETKFDIDFKFDENETSTYIEANEQGGFDKYIYNKKTDLWEKQLEEN